MSVCLFPTTRQANLIIPCPYCRLEPRKGDLPAHMASCKFRPKLGRNSVQHLPSATGPATGTPVSRAGGTRTPPEAALPHRLAGMTVKELRAVAAESGVDMRHCVEKSEMVQALMRNAGASQPRKCMPAAPPNDGWAADAAGISGGRMPCSVCGRRFALDR